MSRSGVGDCQVLSCMDCRFLAKQNNPDVEDCCAKTPKGFNSVDHILGTSWNWVKAAFLQPCSNGACCPTISTTEAACHDLTLCRKMQPSYLDLFQTNLLWCLEIQRPLSLEFQSRQEILVFPPWHALLGPQLLEFSWTWPRKVDSQKPQGLCGAGCSRSWAGQ